MADLKKSWYLPRKLHSPWSGFQGGPASGSIEFGNVGFGGEGKTGVPGEKPLGAE